VDEFGLIRQAFAPLTGAAAPAFGLGDDAAVLRPPEGRDLVTTNDMMVAGRHFFEGDAPDLLARKLLRVNLSDLAAMGAEPIGYLLGLAFAGDLDPAWARRFAQGMGTDQRAFACRLLGGDTVGGAGRLTLSLTALGSVPQEAALLRSGARAGDDVYVSGTLGDAALALRGLRGELEADAALIERYYLPTPRLALGVELRGLASACIDVSDGLVADLGHICARSGVGAELDGPAVPLSPPAQALIARQPELWPACLTGGDDYELVFTAPERARAEIAAAAEGAGAAVSRIGRLAAQDGVTVRDGAGKPIALETRGYRHR